MRTSGNRLFITPLAVTLMLATSGCATKKFVRQQVDALGQRVAQVETNTNQQLAALNQKHEQDTAALDQRLGATETRLAQANSLAVQADARASQAMQLAQSNQAAIASNAAAIATSRPGFAIVETGNVTFAVNKATLSREARAALDLMAQKAQAIDQLVIEVDGFTDRTGSPRQNLVLSKRRADAVAKYLVSRGVPVLSLRVVGRGEEQTPAQLLSDFQAVAGDASAADQRMLARRVRIRILAPKTSPSE